MLMTMGPRPRIWNVLRNRAAVPRCRRIAGAAIVDEGQPLAFRILESECQAAVALEDLAVRDLGFFEALHPPLQGGFTVHTKACTDDAARAAALAWHGPVEKCQVGSGATLGVGIEQMVGAHVVLIDGAFDQPHAERLRVEAVILLNRRRNRGEVMNTGEFHGAPRRSASGIIHQPASRCLSGVPRTSIIH